MWEYLSKLHPLLPYSLIILAMIAIAIIALKGRLMIKWGKNAVGIGGSPDSEEKKPTIPTTIIPPPPGTVYFEKKRSCSDCLRIINNESEKYNYYKKIRADKILTYRMNYTEEKLMELENDITELFEKRIDSYRNDKSSNLIIELKMFYGLLKDVLYEVKKEIRRSCKENGYCELSGLEFSNYVNDKAKVVQSILIKELRNIYPSYGTIVSIDNIISDIESKSREIHDYVEEIFEYAKQIIEDNEKEEKEMDEKYQQWASNFVS